LLQLFEKRGRPEVGGGPAGPAAGTEEVFKVLALI